MIVYFSNVSNFTHRFVEKLDVPASRIPLKTEEAGTFTISEPYILVTPTYGANGREFVPKQVIRFLNNIENRTLIRGVIGTGNRNFLYDYCKASEIVSGKCGVPVLHNLELSGTMEDVETVKEIMEKLDGNLQYSP